MDTDENLAALNSVTSTVIGCAQRVSNNLGCGFLEKVYENALAVELSKAQILFQQQAPMRVMYEDRVVGEYVADFLVHETVLVELKAVSALTGVHQAQALNYLKATGLKVCLLLNFGNSRLEVKRVIL